jgi:hypothetical protein
MDSDGGASQVVNLGVFGGERRETRDRDGVGSVRRSDREFRLSNARPRRVRELQETLWETEDEEHGGHGTWLEPFFTFRGIIQCECCVNDRPTRERTDRRQTTSTLPSLPAKRASKKEDKCNSKQILVQPSRRCLLVSPPVETRTNHS